MCNLWHKTELNDCVTEQYFCHWSTLLTYVKVPYTYKRIIYDQVITYQFTVMSHVMFAPGVCEPGRRQAVSHARRGLPCRRQASPAVSPPASARSEHLAVFVLELKLTCTPIITCHHSSFNVFDKVVIPPNIQIYFKQFMSKYYESPYFYDCTIKTRQILH